MRNCFGDKTLMRMQLKMVGLKKKNYPIFVCFIQYCRALVNSLLPPVFSFSDVFRELKKGTPSSDGLRDL